MKRDKNLEEAAAKILRGEHVLNEARGPIDNYKVPFDGGKLDISVFDEGPMLGPISLPHSDKAKTRVNLRFEFRTDDNEFDQLDRKKYEEAVIKEIKRHITDDTKTVFYWPTKFKLGATYDAVHGTVASNIAKAIEGELEPTPTRQGVFKITRRR